MPKTNLVGLGVSDNMHSKELSLSHQDSFAKINLLLWVENWPIWLNHCHPDTLKKIFSPKNQVTASCIRNNESTKYCQIGILRGRLATKTIKIIQMQTPEVKFRQFIVNRITLALYHTGCVTCSLCHIN